MRVRFLGRLIFDFAVSALVGMLLLLPLSATAATYANAATTFGWIDSSTHTKVGYNTAPYSFKNLGGCGTSPPTIDDTISDRIPLGFSFTFGDKTFDGVRIMSNGRIQFTSTTIPLDNTTCGYGSPVTQLPIPNAGLNYTMRIYGNDLDPTSKIDVPSYSTACNSGTPVTNPTNNPCYVSFASIGSAPARQFVVTWKGVPEWAAASTATGAYNVQLIVNEDGTFVYQFGTDVPGPAASTAQVGWQISTSDWDAPAVGYPVPNTAIKFFVPHPVTEYLMEQATWSGANPVLDTSGNARHAALAGATKPTLTATGKICKGALFTGTSGQAIDTGMAVPAVIGNTGTIAFWYKSSAAVNWNSNTNVDEVLLDATTASGQWFYLVKRGGANAGKLRFVITDSLGTARVVETGANSVASGTWKHIAVTWSFNNYAAANNDHLRIYLDAAAPTQTPFTSTTLTISPGIGTLYLGGSRNSIADAGLGTGSAIGTLDEFRAYNYEATQASISAIMNLNTGGCLNHYSISNSGTGLSCQLSQVTVASHTSAHGAYINNTAITLTADGTGSWVLLTGLGTLTNSGSNTGVATYVFNGESQVLLGYSHSTAANVTFQVTDGSFNQQENTTLVITSCIPGIFNACEYNATRCVPSASSNAYANLYTKLANTAFLLDFVAVQANGTIDPTFTGKTVAVNLLANTSPPTINASTNCPTSQVETVSLGSAVLFTSGRGPAGGVTVPATAFSAASQHLSAYRDVRVQIVCGTPACTPARTVCATDAFTVRPQSFTVSSSANADGTGASAAATPAVKAGTSFTLTANTATPGYNGTPSLDATKAIWAGVPAGGRAAPGVGTLAGSFTTAATLNTGNGAAGSAFSYDEAGYFALQAGGIYDNSFTAVSGDQGNGDCVANSYSNTTDSSGKYGCLIANTATTNHVGRFIPDHFAVVTPVAFAAGCAAGGFSYMDQAFATPLSASIEARNSSDVKTQNYSGASFGKGVVSARLENNNSGTAIAASRLGGMGTPSWAGGAYPFTATQFSRPAAGTVDGPYDALDIGVLVTDSDTVYLINRDMDASNTSCTADTTGTSNGTCTTKKLVSTKARYGRLRLLNAYGSDRIDLAMPFQLQYWNGSAFVLNAADSCTTLAAGNVTLGNKQGGLTTYTGPIAVSATAAGAGTITLTKPAAAASGSVDVVTVLGSSGSPTNCQSIAGGTSAAMPYLSGKWCGANYDRDPTARAAFGIAGSSSKRGAIFIREGY